MSRRPPPGARAGPYARYSSDLQGASQIEFDPVQAAIVRRIHAGYAAGLSPLAITQVLQDADRGGTS